MKEIPDLLFAIGQLNEANKQFFSGASYLDYLVTDDDVEAVVGTVSFEPGCRNNWHIHQNGYQILLVTEGTGWYQERGKVPQLLKAGDTILTKSGIEHWHGATADSWFQHIAITAGKAVWLEPVTDEEYQKLEARK